MELTIGSDRTPILELDPLPKPVRRPKATEAEAQALDKEVIQTLKVMSSSWLRLGSLIQKVIDTRAFEALGFRTMKDWMDARRGRSHRWGSGGSGPGLREDQCRRPVG
jgi:hypothetical protein